MFITYSNPDSKAGLFLSSHQRIKNSIVLLDGYTIMNIQFYDNWFFKKIKIPRKSEISKNLF